MDASLLKLGAALCALVSLLWLFRIAFEESRETGRRVLFIPVYGWLYYYRGWPRTRWPVLLLAISILLAVWAYKVANAPPPAFVDEFF